MSHYQRRAPVPMPHDRRFRLRLGAGFMVVLATEYAVEVEYFSKPAQVVGEWRMILTLDQNPDLTQLHHKYFGWDLVGLCMLLWRQLRDGMLDSTDMRPSHLGLEEEVRRSEVETMELLRSVLSESDEPLSRLQLANALGRAKAPRLIKQLEQMVATGEVKRVETHLKNGKKKYLYRVVTQ